MAYTKTQWSPGDPITQEYMNKIEQGIYDATQTADTASSQSSSAVGAIGSMGSLDQNKISHRENLVAALNDVASTAKDAKDIANTAASDALQGQKAWTQLLSIGVKLDNVGNIATSLVNVLDYGGEQGHQRVLNTDRTTLEALNTAIQNARTLQDQTLSQQPYSVNSNTTLAQRIMAIDKVLSEHTINIRTNAGNIADVNSAETVGENWTLAQRMQQLTNLDAEVKNARKSTYYHTSGMTERTFGSLDERLENSEKEIVEARQSTINNFTYASLDDRLETNEAAINSNTTLIGDVRDATVKYTDIKNNLTSTDTDRPLSAAKGKELKDTIGGSYNSSNTVAAGISSARTTAEDNAKNYADTNKVDKTDIYNGVNYTANDGKVLDARVGKTLQDAIDAINSNLNTADTGLVARLSATEDAIDILNSNASTTGSVLNTVNTRIAAVVNSAPEAFDTLKEIADWIGTHNTDALDMQQDISDNADAISALQTHMTTAETDIDSLQADLDTADIGLKARVATLEDKDTIIVGIPETGSNYTEGVPNISVNEIKVNADYLIADDKGKYFYWRYINNNWKLISGAGGGGTGSSSGKFVASLTDITTPDVNIDYFVGNDTIGYTHYRYIPPVGEGANGTFVRILPKGLLINAGVTANGGLEAYTVENTNDNVFGTFVAFKDVEATPVKDENEQVIATDLVFTNTNGQTVTARVQGGGGGGTTSSYTMRLNNTLNSLKLTVPKKDGYIAYIKSKVVVKDAGVIDETFDQSHTINVTVQYRINSSDPWTNYTTTTALNNTEFSIDVTSILTLDTKTYIRVEASTTIDEEVKSSSLIYEVTQVEMSIAAVNFNQATVRTTGFNFQYRCMGSGLTKQVHFLIDGVDITGSPITTTLHNDISQQNIPLTGLTIGMHSFQVYFTVDGIQSNVLNYYIIYNNDSTRQAPIVALAAENNTITFGDDLKINYTVATIGTETTDKVYLELYALDGSTEILYTNQEFLNVENEQVKEWRPIDYPESGTAYVRATATHTINGTDYTDIKTIQITINELHLPAGYSLDPAGKDNLVYSYNAYGRTNNDANKEVYHYNYKALTGQNIEWTGTFNGFNWSGNGYVDGETLTISGGATHTVNVPIFQNTYNDITLESSEGITNISKLGRTIEIEYEVESATNLNDIIIDYMADTSTTTTNGVIQKGGTGFQVTPQNCYLLKSGSTVNMDNTGFILNESDIAAAYLTPGMRIHLAFVIEPWSDTLAYDQSYHQSVNIYVNGEFANTCPYVQGTDSFANSATLRIGSSSCIIKLYQIKMYNRGLTQKEILQNYKVAPAATRDKLTRLYDNDILNANGYVDYEKARTKYTCLLLTGPAPLVENGVVTNPTISPYKGYPSPANRKDKKTGEVVGKTESGLTLTKPNPNVTQGYDVEFDLRDKIPTDQSIDVPAYMGARGAYVSSNNVQGTSSQKYPVHNLKVYLAKWQGPKTTTSWVALEENEEVPEGTETKTITYKHVANDSEQGYELVEVEEGEDTTGLTLEEITYKRVDTTTAAEIKKVKYALKGKDEHGEDIGTAESTLCWKADYMSTDHANTFNANIADGLFTDVLPGANWGSKHQNTVYGIRCLLFQQQGNAAPEFLGDGCLNNDKGNNKTYDLERSGDEDADTASQKWEFTNNSDDLGYFKTDTIFKIVGEGANAHIQAKDAFESTYPDEGDLKDADKEPNYNHLQILVTWLSHRANYWDETDPTTRATKKQIFINEFTQHINLNHALVYYLFSEYIALCDNRVKNMFMRSDNIRSEKIYKLGSDTPIFDGNSNPNAEFFQDIDTNRSQIDWSRSSFAIWAPVLYDLDSCFGVENVGYIRVRYDADWDYTWNNAPQFNGYESRLWLQFADCFDTEIKAAALTLYNRQDGLNYTNFYRQQITGNLKNISPALSNQDMLIKFDKPWSEGFMNYSLAEPAMETPYYKYLQRGSRTAQKTAFMNMRSKLLSSKYGAKEFTNDAIKFRTGVPVGASGNIIGYENASHEVVSVQDEQHTIPIYGNGDLTETKITVKANQVMYPGVAYGDNKEPTRSLTNNGKIEAEQYCDIYATSAVQGNDGIFICGASMLTDIGDLSKFRPYQIDVGAGVNLKRLIVGSNAAGYTNGNTDTLMNLNKCVLLEEVNIRNCSNVSTLDLSNNPLIKKVYAAGSGATTLIFPNGGTLNTVEYSAVTGNITIRNQGSLTTFSYENSSNNHYSSLTKLWIENTPNVPIVDIINTRLSGLTAGIRLVGLDIDLFTNTSNQQEIDAALETTTLFLNTLVSDVAKGKYLDSEGAFIPNSNQYPYISGKIHITRIRRSLLTKLNTLYPNLIIYNTMDNQGNIVNNVDEEYEVLYYNYDNLTLLYTDYRTSGESVIDPAYDTNPITGYTYLWNTCPPDGLPKKPEDAEFQYRFGTYDNQNKYRRFSGWVYRGTSTNPTSSSTVNGTITFVASYPTKIKQKYTVTWYNKLGGTAIKTIPVEYGDDLSAEATPIEEGTLTRVNTSGTVTSVFTGWSRPLGKITTDTSVYALWQTSTINDDTINLDLSTLNAADIYALALTSSSAKLSTEKLDLKSHLGEVINVPMGYDFNYVEGVNTTDLLTNLENHQLVLDGSTADIQIYNDITPLATNSDWTLAIDYKILMDNISNFTNGIEFVLASCYQNANSSIIGFKLSLVRTEGGSSHAIKITWGTTETIIDYATTDNDGAMYFNSYRNVVVLSHNASEPTQLRVSYVTPNITNSNAPYGANSGTYVTNELLTWNSNTTINTPLILGGNYNGATTIIEESSVSRRPAQGIIYWAKYWDTDLGETGCGKIASWPHETVPFFLSGFNDGATTNSEQIYLGSELSFVAAQGMGDRFFYPLKTNQDGDSNGLYGWHVSVARSICNNTIYQGIPEAYKSIIKYQSTTSGIRNKNNNSNTYTESNSVYDYIFFPSYREVQESATSSNWPGQEVQQKWNSPWHWISKEREVLVFAQGSSTNVRASKVINYRIYRYRFLGKYISNTTRIFNINNDPTGISNLRFIDDNNNTSRITVATGDVWIDNTNVARMYVSPEEIAKGDKINEVAANGLGGWKFSDIWQLRTFGESSPTTCENCFARVHYDGGITTSPTASSNATDPRLLCPEFTV